MPEPKPGSVKFSEAIDLFEIDDIVNAVEVLMSQYPDREPDDA